MQLLAHPKPRRELPAQPPASESDFFACVPAYFRLAREATYPAYDEILYAMRRPLTHGVYQQVLAYVGHHADAGDGDPFAEADRVLRACRYPDPEPLAGLRELGCDLRLATALLHFYNPAFPIYDVPSLAAARRLGREVPFEVQLSGEGLAAYRQFVLLVHDYKERIGHFFVPETHYYLTRVIEGALWGMGATLGALGA